MQPGIYLSDDDTAAQVFTGSFYASMIFVAIHKRSLLLIIHLTKRTTNNGTPIRLGDASSITRYCNSK